MALNRYLIDKSALEQVAKNDKGRRRLADLVTERKAVTCSIIDLEILYSARSAQDWESVHDERKLGFECLELTQEIFDRAIEVQGMLSKAGRHRAPSIPDLVVAACAEHHRVTILHYDADFDIIADETGQAVEWIFPPPKRRHKART